MLVPDFIDVRALAAVDPSCRHQHDTRWRDALHCPDSGFWFFQLRRSMEIRNIH